MEEIFNFKKGGYRVRKLRDIFYINAYPDKNEFVYYGLEFKEFIRFIPFELKNLLLIQSQYYVAGGGSNYSFETVGESDIEELVSEDIYGYGDFTWVDYNHISNVKNLEPREVADLLYLGHMFRPVESPFFDKIENRFAYLAHDDGWFCRLYCRYFEDFTEVIVKKVIDMASTSKKRKIYDFDEEEKLKLLSLAKDGLIIDFSNILRQVKSIEIPIYTIGKFIDMDEMYNGLKRHRGRSKYSAWLVHKNKKWTIEYEVTK